MKRISFVVISLLLASKSHAGFWQQTGQEFISPFTTDAKWYLLGGAAMTGITAFDAVEDTLGTDIQNETTDNRPLGEYSKWGDMAGQMLPNALYIVGMYGMGYFTDDESYNKKSVHMLKSTLYTGLSTTLLKSLLVTVWHNNMFDRAYFTFYW